MIHVDRLAELRGDATRAAEVVREAWRRHAEFKGLTHGLALEALLVRLRRELAP